MINDNPSSGAIRDLRLAAGLSQEGLAREVGCSTAYVRVLERGYAPDPAASEVYRRIVAHLENDEGRSPQSAPAKASAGLGRHETA